MSDSVILASVGISCFSILVLVVILRVYEQRGRGYRASLLSLQNKVAELNSHVEILKSENIRDRGEFARASRVGRREIANLRTIIRAYERGAVAEEPQESTTPKKVFRNDFWGLRSRFSMLGDDDVV